MKRFTLMQNGRFVARFASWKEADEKAHEIFVALNKVSREAAETLDFIILDFS